MGNQVDAALRGHTLQGRETRWHVQNKLLPRLFRVRSCILPIPEQFESEYPTAPLLVKEMQGFSLFCPVSLFA